MNKKLLLSVFSTIAYAIITLIAVLHHEIWADEAQVWLLCENLSIPQLIEHLHNEGHPAFFYFLIMPFAKLFHNIIYMQLICWFFMCLSVFLLLYKSSFDNLVKLAIISSAGFLFFLPVIARSYSILPFLLFSVAVLYQKRKEFPILYAAVIFLIINTHAIMLGFGSILFILFAIETYKNKSRQNIIAASIILLGILLLILQLHDTSTSNSCLGTVEKYGLLSSFIKVSSFFFLNAYNNMITVNKSLVFPLIDIPILLIMISVFIIFFINLFHNNKKLFVISICGIGFQYILYIFTYSSHTYVTRIFSALIILLFCFWILYEEGTFNNKYRICTQKATSILLILFFGLTCYNGINYYMLELKNEYSGSKQTADYIKNNINPNDILLIDNEPYTVSILPYLQNKYTIYSVIRGKNFKYVVWDKYTSPRLSNYIWVEYCQQFNNSDKSVYIIRPVRNNKNKSTSLKDLSEEYNNFKLVYSTEYTIEPSERYKIYKYIK